MTDWILLVGMLGAASVLLVNLAAAPPIDYWDLDGEAPVPRTSFGFLKSGFARWAAIVVFALCVGAHFFQRAG